MGALKQTYLEAEQALFDQYLLGQLNRNEMVKQLEALGKDFYEAHTDADLLDEMNEQHKGA